MFALRPERAGLAPRGPRPARRAGPAHRRPPGRPPPRDRGVALRRGPEGGHPGDARARVRHRGRLPRDDDGVHRAAGRRRRGRGGHPREDAHQHHRPELAARARTRSRRRSRSGSSRRRRARGSRSAADVEPRLVPLYLFKTAETFVAQMEAYVREALEEGLAGWQVTDCRVTMTDCGYASPETSTADFRRLTAARADDGARAGRDLGVRAARRPRARDAGVDGAGRARGARPARRPGDAASSRRTACHAPRPCCRSRGSASLQHQLPGPVDGGGDPRDPAGRLPARRRRPADAAAIRPSPLDRDAWLASLAKRG